LTDVQTVGRVVPTQVWVDLLKDQLREREQRRQAKENAKTGVSLDGMGAPNTIVKCPADDFDTLVDQYRFLDQKLAEHRCGAGAANYTRAKRRAIRWALYEVTRNHPNLLPRWQKFEAEVAGREATKFAAEIGGAK
jgi:hypothetical protein